MMKGRRVAMEGGNHTGVVTRSQDDTLLLRSLITDN